MTDQNTAELLGGHIQTLDADRDNDIQSPDFAYYSIGISWHEVEARYCVTFDLNEEDNDGVEPDDAREIGEAITAALVARSTDGPAS
jgi:hypothetical protein